MRRSKTFSILRIFELTGTVPRISKYETRYFIVWFYPGALLRWEKHTWRVGGTVRAWINSFIKSCASDSRELIIWHRHVS